MTQQEVGVALLIPLVVPGPSFDPTGCRCRNCLRLLTWSDVDRVRGPHLGRLGPGVRIKPAVARDWRGAAARPPGR
jgi:hypothetical protein